MKQNSCFHIIVGTHKKIFEVRDRDPVYWALAKQGFPMWKGSLEFQKFCEEVHSLRNL
jgi:hypothetical protein